MRLVYPPPRSTLPDITAGPCGTQTFGDGNNYTVTVLQPNSILTVEIEQTVFHQKSPFRIALSKVNDDTYDNCILLNHIPQLSLIHI